MNKHITVYTVWERSESMDPYEPSFESIVCAYLIEGDAVKRVNRLQLNYGGVDPHNYEVVTFFLKPIQVKLTGKLPLISVFSALASSPVAEGSAFTECTLLVRDVIRSIEDELTEAKKEIEKLKAQLSCCKYYKDTSGTRLKVGNNVMVKKTIGLLGIEIEEELDKITAEDYETEYVRVGHQ